MDIGIWSGIFLLDHILHLIIFYCVKQYELGKNTFSMSILNHIYHILSPNVNGLLYWIFCILYIISDHIPMWMVRDILYNYLVSYIRSYSNVNVLYWILVYHIWSYSNVNGQWYLILDLISYILQWIFHLIYYIGSYSNMKS